MPGDDLQQQQDQLQLADNYDDAAMHNESAMRRLEELPVDNEQPAGADMQEMPQAPSQQMDTFNEAD